MAGETILVVEDNPVNMELVTDLLDAAGYVVRGAPNAEVGLHVAATEPVSLILMDIALPGMDGLSATRLLKADPRTRPIPVVALTAHAMKGDEALVMSAGCSGYVTKPIDTRTLAKTVASFLQITWSERSGVRNEAA